MLFRSGKMRTKSLFTVAAALAVGVVAAQAQVYSVNIVGYVNVTLEEGNNLISNPLINGGDTLGEVFPPGSVPDGTKVTKWDFASQGFAQADTYFDAGVDSGWFDTGFNPSTTTVDPGEGFFLNVPAGAGSTVVTLVGDVVPSGDVPNTIAGPGIGMYGNAIPAASAFSANNFPSGVAANEMKYQTFEAAANSYSQAFTYFEAGVDSGWFDTSFNPADPTPAVGQGFLINNPNADAEWTQNFDPNN